MDREVWRVLLTAVKSADRRVPRTGRRPSYSDALVVKMYLWSVWHDRPLCWACDRRHYNRLFRPRQLPSVSQFTRRVKTKRLWQMLQAVNDYLTRTDKPVGLAYLDGKPLPVSFCSHDPDARVGWATKGFAKGYKRIIPNASGNNIRVGKRSIEAVNILCASCSQNIRRSRSLRHGASGEPHRGSLFWAAILVDV